MTEERRPKQLTPTPANPLTVLIAGGPADVARELKAWLAPRGLRVANHWPSDKMKIFGRPIPAGTELVIILCKHLGHSACDAVTAACKRAGVRRVMTVWNRSRLAADLEHAGVRLAAPRPAFDPVPAREEADPEAARCVWQANGHRCAAQAGAGDTLCGHHRQEFDAAGPSKQLERAVEAAEGMAMTKAAVNLIAQVSAVGTPDDTGAASEPWPGRPLFDGTPQPHAVPLAPCPSAAAPAADAPPPAPAAAWPAGYVTPPTKAQATWAPAHVEALTRLTEAGGADAFRLVTDLHAATGVYRAPGGLAIFLRPLTAVGVKAAPGLLVGLERLTKAQTAARRTADVAEAAACKRGRPPELLSRAAAARLVGGVATRLAGLDCRLECATGRLVYRRADVLARQAALEARAGGALTKERVNNNPRTTPDAEVEQRVRAALAGTPGQSVWQLAKACHCDRDRVQAALDRLTASRTLVRWGGAGHGGAEVYGPAGWAPAVKAPKAPRVPRAAVGKGNGAMVANGAVGLVNAVTPAPVISTAPPAAGDPVLDAVIAAIDNGRLDPAKGAALLAALRSK